MSDKNLTPLSEKSLAPVEQSLVKKHSESITQGVAGNTLYDLLRNGGPTAMTQIMAFLAYMQGWSWPMIILGSAGVFLVLTIAVAIVITLRQRYRRGRRPTALESNDLVKELEGRIRELEEEKAALEAAKAKPDITGEIKEVFLEEYANGELCRRDPEHMYFDYHFIVNVYLANHGAPTTIEQFKLVLKTGGRSYDGEIEKDARNLKEGETNWRAWGADELVDLEKLNDEPLEHTRNGSLWFVVAGVQGIKNKAEMELELYVIDKNETPYKLLTLPQPQWQRNPFYYEAMVAAQRARMKHIW